MAKTNAQLQKTRDDKQRAMGRKGRKVWATPEEHIHINECLAKYRRKQERLAKKRKD